MLTFSSVEEYARSRATVGPEYLYRSEADGTFTCRARYQGKTFGSWENTAARTKKLAKQLAAKCIYLHIDTVRAQIY